LPISIRPNARQFSFENEEQFLNVGMQMQWPFISGRNDHGAQSEMTRFDDLGIVVLARSTAADITHLGAAIFGICPRLKVQYVPIGLSVFKTRDVFVDLVDAWNYFVHGSSVFKMFHGHGSLSTNKPSWIRLAGHGHTQF